MSKDTSVSTPNHKPQNKSECFDEDENFSLTADFGNGFEMDIKLCGVQYEEGADNLPWAEAVLFHNGSEVAVSEVSESFFGRWILEYDGEEYVVDVLKKDRAPLITKILLDMTTWSDGYPTGVVYFNEKNQAIASDFADTKAEFEESIDWFRNEISPAVTVEAKVLPEDLECEALVQLVKDVNKYIADSVVAVLKGQNI